MCFQGICVYLAAPNAYLNPRDIFEDILQPRLNLLEHLFIVTPISVVVVFSSTARRARMESSPHFWRHWISLRKLLELPSQPP